MADLLIKINAESKQFSDAIDDAKAKTADLEANLGAVTKVSGAVFAGLIAAGGLAVKAFAESDQASKELKLSLQNQGIASEDLFNKYKKLADGISAKTGIDDDAIVAGQAVLQGFLGQTEASEKLLTVTADLSVKTGDYSSAAKIVGLAVNGNVKGLKQYGITIDENLTKEERLVQVTEKLTQKFGGLAEANASGLGNFKKLEVLIGNFVEGVGQRLAPIVIRATDALISFFTALNENEALIDFIVNTGKIVAIAAGLVTSLGLGALAFLKLQQAMLIAKTAMTLLGISTKALIGATGIGLILIIAAEIYLNWSQIWPRMQAVFSAFVNNISAIGSALAQILLGIFTGNYRAIIEGVKSGAAVATKGLADYNKVADEKLKELNALNKEAGLVQLEDKKLLAEEARKLTEEQASRDLALATSEQELKMAQAEEDSAAFIALKQREVDTLKLIADAKFEGDKTKLTERAAALRAAAAEQQAADASQLEAYRQQQFGIAQVADGAELARQQAHIKTQVDLATKGVVTGQNVQIVAQQQRGDIQKKSEEDFIKSKEKYGLAYAHIEQTLNDTSVKGFKSGTAELTQLTNSKNKELKAIGKAATIAQITIKTAESAMNVYASFAAIPFVGIPLGIAGAAAVAAYGAEQIGDVVAAQRGGVVPGFNSGGDSVPAMLQPGELVVPRANFGEVVNAVAGQRIQESPEASSGISTGGAGGTQVSVSLQFSGDGAEKFLTARQVEARSLGTLREASA